MHVLGFDGPGTVSASVANHIVGFATVRTSQMGIRKQARVFYVSEVIMLEKLVACNELDDRTFVVITCALVLIALRARFDELQYMLELVGEEQFISAIISQSKTSGRQRDRLPLTLLGWRTLFSGIDWFSVFVERRRSMRIPLPEFPLFPAFDGEGYETSSGDNKSFNTELRHALHILGLPLTSSHGCKPTLLSLFAAHPSFDPVVANALGYHQQPGQSSTTKSYARDVLTAPVRKLGAILDSYWKADRINSPSYAQTLPAVSDPYSISDYEVSQTQEFAAPTVPSDVDGELEDALDSLLRPTPFWDTSSTMPIGGVEPIFVECSDSDDSIMEMADGAEGADSCATLVSDVRVLAGTERKKEARTSDNRRLVHAETKLLHRGRKGTTPKLACGRFVTNRYTEVFGDIGMENRCTSDMLCAACYRLDQENNPDTELSD